MQIADDGASGDVEPAGEGGDVGARRGVADQSEDFVLPAETVGGAAEQIVNIGAAGTFEGFKGPHDFGFAALVEGSAEGVPEVVEIDRFGETEVGAARSLEGFDLFPDVHGPTDYDHGDVGHGFFQFGEVIEAEVAVVEDVVEDDDVRSGLGEQVECFAAGAGPGQMEIIREGVFVDLGLEIVVLDDEDARFFHGPGFRLGLGGASRKESPSGSVWGKVGFMVPAFRIEAFEFFVRRTRTRFPFRYGIASMTEVPHLFVRVRMVVGGEAGVGLASEGLPPKWFTKDPTTTFEQDLPAMFAVIGKAAATGIEAGREERGFFPWWRDLTSGHLTWGKAQEHPGLLLGLGSSLIERAVLDGLARGTGWPVHRLFGEDRLGVNLGDIHRELAGTRVADWLPAAPLPEVLVRHTVGLADGLVEGDIAETDRVRDGLPQDLAASIRAYGLKAFKVKLFGDSTKDLPRLRAVQEVLAANVPGTPLVTLDGNENFKSFAAFRAFWEQVDGDSALVGLRRQVVLVEQPVHRDHALEDEAGRVLGEWRERPPLIIDESDGAAGDLPRALALGYAGASHKNCKGVVKGVANACLLAKRRRDGASGILTGEDLCNLGPVALLQDLASMAMLGVPHVERNGHHYFRGLTLWPEDWQQTTVDAHPDLYVRDGGGFVRLAINDGKIGLDSVNSAPFGVRPCFDPAAAGFEAVQIAS